MIYLIWYLAVGIIVLLVVYISHRLPLNHESDREQELIKLTHELMDSLDHTRKTWRDDLLDKIVVPLLAASLILAAWPAVLLMLVKNKLFPSEVKLLPDRKFSVASGDLIRQMTIEEIEQQEQVVDPMRAVPDLPFGHLNAAWVEFKANLEQQDSVWSFAAHWTPDWGAQRNSRRLCNLARR